MSYYNTGGYAPQKSALDVTEGLSNLGDALTDVLNRRQKTQQAQAELAFKQQDEERKNRQTDASIAYNQRMASRGERRDEITFAEQQAERQRRAEADAAKAVGEGNPELANATMRGTQTFDPHTGAPTGAGEMVPGPLRDVGPAPAAPGPVPAAPAPLPPEVLARRRGITNTSVQPGYVSKGLPMPPAVGVDPLAPKMIPGPTLTDDGKPPNPAVVSMRQFDPETQAARFQDTKDMMAEEQQRLDQAQFDKDKPAYDAKAAAYPAQQAAYTAEQRQAERERLYTLRFGEKDPGVQITEQQQRYSHRNAAADDFATTVAAMPNLSETDKNAAALAHAAILAGEDPKQVMKQFNLERTTGEKFGNTMQLAGVNNAASLERTKLMAAAKAGQADPQWAKVAELRAAGNRQDRATFDREFSDWESKAAGLPLDAKAYKRLAFVATNLDSGNPTQQKEAAEGLVGFFRGGVTTGAAQKFVLGQIGGMGARAQTALERVTTGKYGAEDLAILQQAAKNAVSEQQNLAQRHYESARRIFGPGSGNDELAGNINARVQGTLRDFGYESPPLYPEAEPMQLGSNTRPYQTKPKRKAGAPPEIKAGNAAKDKAALHDELMQ